MDMEAVSSSQIEAVGFDNNTRVLAVKFKGKTPIVYLYDGVTLELYRQFLAAPSKGKFLAQQVRTKYMGRRVHA